MIEGQPVDFSHNIRITDCKVYAFHILLPVPVTYNGVGYDGMQAASHSVGLPAMPKIEDLIGALPLDTDKLMSDHIIYDPAPGDLNVKWSRYTSTPRRLIRKSMTTIHVQHVGDKAVLSQREFERLIDIARQCEEIVLQLHEDDVPTPGIMRLVEQAGAFDFWREAGEDIYSAEDGEPV